MDSEAMELNGDAHGGDPGVHPRQSRWSRNTPINMNHYANKKSAAESMLDIALLMANASQLKTVLEVGPSFSLYIPLISLISISLILQIIVGVLLIFIDLQSVVSAAGSPPAPRARTPPPGSSPGSSRSAPASGARSPRGASWARPR
uniref:Si:ch1073-278o19.1 n=1 Tax=Cyprinus carpio TaxID=7962 RepID=A0A8C2FMV6_CYPCA